MRHTYNKLIFIIIFILFFYADVLRAEYIFLKDGKIIQGTIVSDESDIIAAKIGNKTEKIPRSNIIRILYTELGMGKVYIQKRDGTSVIAYIVDEDRVSYVCRKDLYSAEEFTLKRSDVLFVAEKNPSGLKGEADMTFVKLSWLPPYDPVNTYNIYIKTGKNKYEKIDSTSKKEITIKNLKSNTEYYFIIKSVDRDNYESSPSNEIKLTTKNIPPLPPKQTLVTEMQDGNFQVTWQAAVDPDGTIKEYKLYKVLNRKTSVFATTAKTEHIVSIKEGFDRIFIKSVDNLNTESEDTASVYFGPRPEIDFSVHPLFAMPMQILKKATEYGYGISVRGGISNYYLIGLDLRLEVSYIFFKGKDSFSAAPENEVKSVTLIPALLSAGYSFYPFKALRVSPAVYLGACYMQNKYSYFDIVESAAKTKAETAYEPALGAGLSITWDRSPWFFGVSGEYRYIYEKSGKIAYWYVAPQAGIRF
jgi:hypothetical protein